MEVLAAIAGNSTVLALLLVPPVMALTGWAASWLAIQALFRPQSFVGIGPLGWRGIVPAQAGVIAPRLVDSLLERVGTLHDVFHALDPERLAEHIVLSIRPRVDELIEDVVLQEAPELWETLGEQDRKTLAGTIEQALPEVAEALMVEVGQQIDSLIRVDYLVDKRLVQQPAVLVRLFREVGREEFAFLAHAGLLSGLGAGVGALLLWLLLPQWWLLPLSGGLFGAAGSALALRAVYRPLRPTRVGPWRLHGLLPSNQEKGSQIGARLFTRHIVSLCNLVEDALDGPGGARLRRIVAGHTEPMIATAIDSVRDRLRVAGSPQRIQQVQEALAERAVDLALEPLTDTSFNHERQVVLEDVFVNRMLDLTAEEYEALLRPAVRDSEWLFVTAGGVAGVLGGLLLAFL